VPVIKKAKLVGLVTKRILFEASPSPAISLDLADECAKIGVHSYLRKTCECERLFEMLTVG